MVNRSFRYVTVEVPVFYNENENWIDAAKRVIPRGSVMRNVTVEYPANRHPDPQYDCGKGRYCPEYGEGFITSGRARF